MKNLESVWITVITIALLGGCTKGQNDPKDAGESESATSTADEEARTDVGGDTGSGNSSDDTAADTNENEGDDSNTDNDGETDRTSSQDNNDNTAGDSDADSNSDSASDGTSPENTDDDTENDSASSQDSDSVSTGDTDDDTDTHADDDDSAVAETDSGTDSDSVSTQDTGDDTEPPEPVACPNWLDQIDEDTRNAGGLRLSEQFLSEVLFHSSSDQIALTLYTDQDADATVKVIDLFSRQETVISQTAWTLDWFVPDQSLFVVHGGDTCCRPLSVFTLEGASRTISDAACDYEPSTNNRAFVMESCEERRGILSLVDVENNTKEQLAENYPQFSTLRQPAFSKDGTVAAYVAFDDAEEDRSRAVIFIDANGTISQTTPWAEEWGGLEFLDDGSLIIQADDSFLDYDLMRYMPDTDELIPLATDRFAWSADLGYTLSPDQRHLLAAHVDISSNDPNVLVQIPLDGSGEQVLATNLIRFQDSAAMISPLFKYTPDGEYIYYLAQWDAELTYQPGLGIVPVTGGDPMHIDMYDVTPEWHLSPSGNDVAYTVIEDDPERHHDLHINSPDLNERTILSLQEGSVLGFSYVPTGKGIVYLKSGEPISLNYIDVNGGSQVHLGDTSNPPARGSWYEIDPKGCYVIYKADSDTQTGTYLQPLP